MSRRRRSVKRVVEKDPCYGSALISQLINVVMQRGKKNLARSIVYSALENVSEKLGKSDPVDLLLGAIENSRVKVEVKSRRVGGATYQVPVEIPYERQYALVFRWMVDFANARKGLPMKESLAQEIIDAYNNTGSVVKKKDDVQRMAQANRAFAHLRW